MTFIRYRRDVSPEPNETCWTVVHAAAHGDDAARSTFSRSYATPIRSYLQQRWSGLGLAADVDDAVQDVFIECLKPGGVLERANPERGDFRGLLYGVVRNVARRFEERRAKSGSLRSGASVHLDDLPAAADTLSRMFDRTWAQSLLGEAVIRHASEARSRGGDYNRRYRILQLRHQQNLPIREIAMLLSEPDVDQIHNEYRRARREFGVLMREVIIDHTGARGDAVNAECRRLTELLGS